MLRKSSVFFFGQGLGWKRSGLMSHPAMVVVVLVIDSLPSHPNSSSENEPHEVMPHSVDNDQRSCLG